MYCLFRQQYKSKRVHVPKYKHFPTTGYAQVLLFMLIRRELAEERYRMFISVYILCVYHIVFFHRNGLITVNEILQFEAVNVIYLYKIHITWISSYFCLQRFSSIFESTVRLAERLFVCLFDCLI